MPRKWSVWIEGYAATGGSGRATYQGEWPGETFTDACREWAKRSKCLGDFSVRDGLPRYWGCRMYDNESDARRAFG